jgi:hypothetical protein
MISSFLPQSKYIPYLYGASICLLFLVLATKLKPFKTEEERKLHNTSLTCLCAVLMISFAVQSQYNQSYELMTALKSRGEETSPQLDHIVNNLSTMYGILMLFYFWPYLYTGWTILGAARSIDFKALEKKTPEVELMALTDDKKKGIVKQCDPNSIHDPVFIINPVIYDKKKGRLLIE